MQEYTIQSADSPEMMEACFFVRREVFVKGQNVPAELDLDGKDEQAIHLIAYKTEGESMSPLGTLRLRRISPAVMKLERAAVLEAARGKGIGKALVEKSISCCRELGVKKIVLHSQLKAVSLYQKAGFTASGETFLEADIQHIKMEKNI